MDRKYVIVIAVCVTVIVVIIVIVVVVVALLIRRRRQGVRLQRPRPQSSVPFSLEHKNVSFGELSRDAIVPGSGIDDLELTGVTNSPTGEAIKAVCPPTPPVGGAAPPRLDPI
ncbi:uncharacterized protein LOC124119526 isoform X5 [Haliotis rufescens]|uniref:uncharacterized protein LOC124119526 isoform X5 n=1 Tax=Haliotis rufescens TaxID=6454 RepID=UPI00201F6E14|nr:uncharacterized protein LOC124119526 isoform X5 [Haliotis rufescens]XP_048240936.1 uncharacterized protein LOC124119526 isoform X5 [Haliotis rufescens]XP_048240937.1 uncharacterized protein LOC124119526 isoform X5 [Haliotis rufescens]XP_048240938.1 uncharacterized protein LOC124119526 isoform X5 [Haliotis rufescens]XP_048240939.1 uncharacterized protein LOC124119526 isoform X5 [Haliotis rufescens]